jgi:hypothetical protein
MLSSASPLFARRLVPAMVGTALLAFALGSHAHRAMAAADMHPETAKAATGLAWQALTPGQRKALEPLAAQWGQLDDNGRQKWIKVASRFDALTPQERQRLQERMKQWAALPPSERGEARLRFQQTRQLPSDERQQKWAAYQSLSLEDRQDLTRQAQRRTRTVMLADNTVGPREAGQAFAAKRQTAAASAPGKSNVVPSVPTGLSGPNAQGALRVVVAPTLVKASTGATTNLVTRQPAPSVHQASGSTKITASKDYVDPVTLLPRKGAQSAAMASLPASGTGVAP